MLPKDRKSRLKYSQRNPKDRTRCPKDRQSRPKGVLKDCVERATNIVAIAQGQVPGSTWESFVCDQGAKASLKASRGTFGITF